MRILQKQIPYNLRNIKAQLDRYPVGQRYENAIRIYNEKSVDFAGFIALNLKVKKFYFRKNKRSFVDEV
jgi:hypothetical protein